MARTVSRRILFIKKKKGIPWLEKAARTTPPDDWETRSTRAMTTSFGALAPSQRVCPKKGKAAVAWAGLALCLSTIAWLGKDAVKQFFSGAAPVSSERAGIEKSVIWRGQQGMNFEPDKLSGDGQHTEETFIATYSTGTTGPRTSPSSPTAGTTAKPVTHSPRGTCNIRMSVSGKSAAEIVNCLSQLQ